MMMKIPNCILLLLFNSRLIAKFLQLKFLYNIFIRENRVSKRYIWLEEAGKEVVRPFKNLIKIWNFFSISLDCNRIKTFLSGGVNEF